MHPLAGPREKLGCAQERALELEGLIGRFWTENTHEVVIAERERRSEYHALRARVSSPPPLKWGVIVGEIVHDLRSSLDGLLWQAIVSNGIDPGTLTRPKPEFPIYLRGKARGGSRGYYPGFDPDGLRRIHGRVSRQTEAIIKGLQPYHRRNKGRLSTLWCLHELNIADKHRLVQLAAAQTGGAFGDYMFGGPPPRGLTYTDLRALIRYRSGSFLIDGARVGSIHQSVVGEMEVKMRPITHVAFRDGCDAVKGMPVMQLINTMGLHLNQVMFGNFAPVFAPFPSEWGQA